MFGLWKKKQAEESGSNTAGEPIISALLLEGDTFSFSRCVKQLKELDFFGKTPKDIEVREESMMTFGLGKEIVAWAHMPAPYPKSDLEGPLETSWMWPDDVDIKQVKKHRSHLLLTMTGGTGNAIRRRLNLTAMTAMAARQKGVLAVYWAEATLVHYPPVFMEMAEKIDNPEAPPLYLWVDYRLFQNDDGSTAAFTTGLTALGHMEIEIPSIEMEPGELREWLINISYYLLEKGPVLKHGDTIGVDENHKVRIQHTKSKFGHTGKVIRMIP